MTAITTPTYALQQEELIQTDKIKKLLTKQAIEHPLGMPCYYAVLYYGKSYYGGRLSSVEYRKRWDRNEIKKTHKFITGLIHKCFGEEVPLWWCINRHDDYEDADGNCKKGSFHSDLYIGEIPDKAVERPFRFVKPSVIPIALEDKKLFLLEACIRQSKWVGQYKNSLKISKVPPEEFEQTFDYGLKDVNSSETFNEIVDWKNSNFYTQNKEKN